MDFGGLLVLGLVWLLFNLLGRSKGNTPTAPGRAPQRPGPQPRVPGAPDATQQEGSRLEQLLRELERNLEGAAGTQPAGGSRVPLPQRPTASQLPAPVPEEEEVVEELESLEEPERVVSLETDVRRQQRVVYDQDTGAEELVRRRIDAARSRDRALSKADHKAFDARIRREVVDHTAVRRYTPEQLRDAVIWREILGPPVSEQDR